MQKFWDGPIDYDTVHVCMYVLTLTLHIGDMYIYYCPCIVCPIPTDFRSSTTAYTATYNLRSLINAHPTGAPFLRNVAHGTYTYPDACTLYT